MALDKQAIVAAKTPAAIGQITVTLQQVGSASVGLEDGQVVFDVRDGNGDYMATRRHDLLPILTANEITQLGTFLNNLRARIITAVLP